ncbi:MAG: hypothetical protein ACRDOU_27620 [Streptosporangiaceae bacterium]
MDLDGAWQRALEQAWQSFLAGTTPVGAVVTDSLGEIVAEGRGRRYENLYPVAFRRPRPLRRGIGPGG